MKVLFLTLNIFSVTGGIQKVCRVAGKALYEINDGPVIIFSLHDAQKDVNNTYFPESIFKAFSGKKISFIIHSIRAGVKSRLVILSHINLLLPGYLIKILFPKTKLVLIAHGIEVWKPLSVSKKKMLRFVDYILPVSTYTKDNMKELFNLEEEKFHVLNNCLDPFLPEPSDMSHRDNFRSQYNINKCDIVLMTLSRLTAKEKNKGYDKVLKGMEQLKEVHPNLKYLFVGKYENDEKQRLEAMALGIGMAHALIFTGFVQDHDLAAYYNMADIYIMPSEKEGFGISFIEAMYYHKPVIAGNRDGSADALLNGALGILIDPRSQQDITGAIKKLIENIPAYTPDRTLLLNNFSYPVYKEKWNAIISNLLQERNLAS